LATVLWPGVSFRARLRLFFVLLVIVPMIALAVVLFTLTARSETGKADAGISAGARTAFGVYEEAARQAEPALREVADDRRLRVALASGSRVAFRLEELVDGSGAGASAGGDSGSDGRLEGPGRIVSIELYSRDGRLIDRAGSPAAVAPRGAPIAARGRALGTLSVSVTRADDFAARVHGLTGLEVAVYRAGRLLAASAGGLEDRESVGGLGDPHDIDLGGDDYRGRVDSIGEPAGPSVELALLQDTGGLSETIAENRLVIGGLMLAFLLLAGLAAAGVSRALTGQIGKFLAAARRLARGDFAQPVPVSGRDEFAQLGREFNSMSSQLEAKIDEVERKRKELEETIRRVGDALATGLDRNGVVALAVRQAVDACGADAGRALPLERGAFDESRSGRDDSHLAEAMVAAERSAFEPKAEVGPELLEPIDPEAPPPRPRRASSAEAAGAHALAVPMRALVASSEPEYLGVLSIARYGRRFSRVEEELLEYLAGQAIVSIENASLHETVERQAVTDELTGLANARAFRSILEREIERSRRFQSPLGLVMVDLDDFKQVNDRHGHQQGDEVLASVAAVLRDFSRDIDAPARYGGEELAVVLPQTDAEGAALLAERMRQAVEGLRVPRVGGRGSLRVTASFGVAAVPESAADQEELVAAADAALYRAKRGGKNRVERAERVVAAG
jgi:diguanylate cyclase (GGDEF)-like protein